jgi:hypothetical protein
MIVIIIIFIKKNVQIKIMYNTIIFHTSFSHFIRIYLVEKYQCKLPHYSHYIIHVPRVLKIYAQIWYLEKKRLKITIQSLLKCKITSFLYKQNNYRVITLCHYKNWLKEYTKLNWQLNMECSFPNIVYTFTHSNETYSGHMQEELTRFQ